MKTKTAFVLLSLTLLCPTVAHADSFGSGANTFDIEFVNIGNPGNPADTTGYPNPAGKVDYSYRMGKFEISEQMIDKANAVGGLGITYYDFPGVDKPATEISWIEAAQFVNWLNESTNHTPAYKFDGSGNFQLWQSGDAGYNPSNRFRNSQAYYFLPSTDEWYKAAYYDPVAHVYYDYPTGSDSVPDGIDSLLDTSFDAMFYDGGFISDPNDITNVGVLSPYGTAGQGGNVWEWEETEWDLVNDSSSSIRGSRGGAWEDNSDFLQAASRNGYHPTGEGFFLGLRVASIPEPSTVSFGDYNGNDEIDAADYTVWRDALSAGSSSLLNDPTPGIVDESDFLYWREHFGEAPGSGAGSAAAIPEPSAALLLCIGALCLAPLRRWPRLR